MTSVASENHVKTIASASSRREVSFVSMSPPSLQQRLNDQPLRYGVRSDATARLTVGTRDRSWNESVWLWIANWENGSMNWVCNDLIFVTGAHIFPERLEKRSDS